MDYTNYALMLMEQENLVGWKFSINKRLSTTLGRCIYSAKIIELSNLHIEHDTEELVCDTIKHEIAHAIVGPGHNHDIIWKNVAARLGATPKASTNKCNTLAKAKWVCIIDGAKEVVHSWMRKPSQATFDTIKTKYLPSREEDTLGKLSIISIEEYLRK